MTYGDFVAQIVVVAGSTRTYDTEAACAGSLSGFEAILTCATPQALGVLLAFARNQQLEILAGETDPGAGEFARAFTNEVEWACNCVSALLLNEGLQPLITPSSRGILACAELLGAAPGGVPVEPQWFLDSPGAGTPDCLCSFCGCPIPVSLAMVRRLWDSNRLELRACERDACTVAFLNLGAVSVSS